MSQDKSQDGGGLSPQYKNYQRQKCFIAYTEQAEWAEDLLSACKEVVSRPEFNLELDYARKHFDPDVTLRQKALELIANARYGIYDLSCWQDEKGKWQIPRNVFIELGMAIALNRSTLLLRHTKNREMELPECLKSLSGQILEFSGFYSLKQELTKNLSKWIGPPPEQSWWNHYCLFGCRVCKYREVHPRAKQFGKKRLSCHISDSSDVDRQDFRGMTEEVLERFSNLTYTYLDELSVVDDYKFLLCTYCQAVRLSSLAIYRITPNSSADTLIAIGINIALEKQFDYKIPKILITENLKNVPSLLSGYEVVIARSDKERKTYLQTFMPALLKRICETTWNPRPLPFTETSVLFNEEPKLEKTSGTEPESKLYTNEQIKTWLRGLLTVAWADGNYCPEEQEMITQLTQDELAHDTDLLSLDKQISPGELAAALGKNSTAAENFLRTAVMVALADGVYSSTEVEVLQEFCEALELKVEALDALEITLYDHQVIEQSESRTVISTQLPISQEITVSVQLYDSTARKTTEAPTGMGLGEFREAAQEILGLSTSQPCLLILERTGEKMKDELTFQSVGIQPNDTFTLVPLSQEITVSVQLYDSTARKTTEVPTGMGLGEFREAAQEILGLSTSQPCLLILERTGEKMKDELTFQSAGIQPNDIFTLVPYFID